MDPVKRFSAVIPAAGYSSRMNSFKPLLPLGDTSILETSIRLFRQNGIRNIIVVTGHRSKELETVIKKQNASMVFNAGYDQGMFSTVLTGIGHLPDDCEAFFLLPADIPAVKPDTVKQLIQAYTTGKGAIIYPVFDNLRGHPPLISGSLASAICRWRHGGGLRACLMQFDSTAWDCHVSDEGIHMDADTQEDYRTLADYYKKTFSPGTRECMYLLEKIEKVDKQIVNHCVKVAEIAVGLAWSLSGSIALDIHTIKSASLLHDISRAQRNHAKQGARLLAAHGFHDFAQIVYEHMDLETSPELPLNEKEIVFFADKLTVDDHLEIDFMKRFRQKLSIHESDSRAVSAIRKRLETTCMIRDKIETILGKRIEEVLNDLPAETW